MARRLAPSGGDLLVAAVLVAVAGLELWLNSELEPKWVAVPLELAAGLAVAWRRLLPLATVSFVSAVLTLESIAGVPIQVPLVPMLAIIVALYSLVAHAPLERVFAGLAVVAVGLAAAVTSQREGLDNFAFGAMFFGAAILVGWLVRVRIEEARGLERRAEQLERARVEQMRLAAEGERRRIARELHDVIAHSLTVMVVQAGAAEQMLRGDPARALAPVLSVQETGRKAIAEMSRLLGVLVEQGEEVGLAPQPGLDDLGALLADVRAVGLPVDLHVVGHRRPLPMGVELSAYRIVQEALTNARKHAGDARARVTIGYGDDALEVEVVDDGPGDPDGAGGGLGLVGMRERVSVFGGSLDAGPRADGGFGVHARLPLGGGT